MKDFTAKETKALEYVARLANINLDHGTKKWQDAIWLAARFANRKYPNTPVIEAVLAEDAKGETRDMVSYLMRG